MVKTKKRIPTSKPLASELPGLASLLRSFSALEVLSLLSKETI